ncbi:hypothetical protein [Myroides odoratus]|uniref:Uncharacterized protein n=1 Tax=Myroides odoratus TaxID=256 RepID=A0A9Q6ZAR9_MYROD|nr:hypothetical protein [Myroides odoratus]EHQ41499.1 hypothetical protein Myrod_0663 [Myroides odoratus DSM 2801]EKB02708.1 hypothetical protein HMPREF9716_03737 [Myroides odoratus CIP 103059]QQT98925.1 hypothetical protein I6I88_11940 [Myroides odoratus]WQD58890.1 hypothetical protein U0010_07035 [Myroides odoratus]STZ28762.1 Uncharacterised protein [Myroides odoratus]
MANEISTLPHYQLAAAETINEQVLAVLSDKSQNFKNAFAMANAISIIRNTLTPEVMQPIMSLAGSKLGFRTDKDKPSKGQTPQPYSLDIVKDCLIDAVLLGLNPTGNQFNIIASNMYVTKEGFTFLLKKIKGLRYSIIYPSTNFAQNRETAQVNCEVTYQIGEEKPIKQLLEFTVKSGPYATTDSCNGKAERKAKCWLYNHIEGTDITDGDAEDIQYTEVSSTRLSKEEQIKEKELSRLKDHLERADKLSAILQVKQSIADSDNFELQELYNSKENELIPLAIQGIENLKDLEKLSPHIEQIEHIVLLDDKKRELGAQA